MCELPSLPRLSRRTWRGGLAALILLFIYSFLHDHSEPHRWLLLLAGPVNSKILIQATFESWSIDMLLGPQVQEYDFADNQRYAMRNDTHV